MLCGCKVTRKHFAVYDGPYRFITLSGKVHGYKQNLFRFHCGKRHMGQSFVALVFDPDSVCIKYLLHVCFQWPCKATQGVNMVGGKRGGITFV